MNLYTVPFYRHAPFLRLVIPFATGIFLQFEISPPVSSLWLLGSIFTATAIIAGFRSAGGLYASREVRGTIINACLVLFGAIMMYYGNPANNPSNLVHSYTAGATMVMTLEEPLSERAGSYRSTASIELIQKNGGFRQCSGTILLYFEKDPVHLKLRYGDRLISSAALQPVSNTGNPASFDYRQYCFLQGIYHQVYLTGSEFVSTGVTKRSRLKDFLFRSRRQIITLLKTYIPGPKEAGLAGALLIGVKDDLDRDLVQSYSNTGVVHVIAISGLHLGLIYAILVLLTGRLTRMRQGKLIRLAIILAGIWLFSLLAGGSPSVIRSAVMFSCIATGNAISKASSIYNSLACSAFLLLAYNPLWLWDTGFQLSYAAVLSIIIFQSRVLDLFDLRNKILVMLWKTCAITISAQILTTPVSIYYFHQFPLMFLVTNFVAIPLSSLILICEIVLCVLAPLPLFAGMIGRLTGGLISIMNTFVEFIDALPYANWQGLQIDKFQFVLLFIVIAAFDMFIRKQSFYGLLTSLLALFVFFGVRSISFYQAGLQEKLIVYNISKQSAIELIHGRHALFIADPALINNEQQIRFHIIPSRILHRVQQVSAPDNQQMRDIIIAAQRKKVLRVSGQVDLQIRVNILIISGNARGSFRDMISGITPELVVFDCSNSRSRIKAWLTECRRLGVATWSVPDQGAFVMKLN